MFDTQQNHQFQYSFAQGKFIVDLTFNGTEDKLFAVDGVCILVYAPQGQFLYSIAVDPVHCGLLVASICSTPDGHLLVGTKVSSNFLLVYHEDSTLVCDCENNENFTKDDFEFQSTCTICITRNGQLYSMSKIIISLSTVVLNSRDW